jgi:hypothetical protein
MSSLRFYDKFDILLKRIINGVAGLKYYITVFIIRIKTPVANKEKNETLLRDIKSGLLQDGHQYRFF